MKEKKRRRERFYLAVMLGMVPLILVLSRVLDLSYAATVVLTVAGLLVCASLALWVHANRRADGEEWWQDDDASGWRGY